MRIINADLEDELLLVEQKKDDIEIARKSLEKALTQQMQQLTLSLLSYELLCGRDIKKKDLDMAISIIKCLNSHFEIKEEDAISLISESIYQKKWPSLYLRDMRDLQLRILGKNVYLWNVIEVNEQLALLGSDYRLFFAGSMELANEYIKKQIGVEDNNIEFDCRYIWGKIGPISISIGGPVFDFCTEEVSSPYLLDTAPGFSIGDTAIIRRTLLKDSNDENSFHVFTHEVIHTISHSFKDKSPFVVANWDLYIKRDICRFLKTPHKKADIDTAFNILINNTMNRVLDNIDNKEHLLELPTFNDIFDELLSKKIITVNEDGYYNCKKYQGGEEWGIF